MLDFAGMNAAKSQYIGQNAGYANAAALREIGKIMLSERENGLESLKDYG